MAIKEFWCKDDLTPYVDSMLFDSGEEIAFMRYEDGEDKLELSLKIVGDVRVWYKDELYRYPSEFPEDLKELIKHDNWFYTDEDIDVGNNNWFECLWYHDNNKKNIHYADGILYEADLSEDNPDGIKDWFIEIINSVLHN